MTDDFTEYAEPKSVEWTGSTTTTPMVLRHGPWYTYTRAATVGEIATGISELTAYDLSMLGSHGWTGETFQASERERLRNKGLDL